MSETITDAKVYTAIAWVMTLGIMPSIILVPLLLRRIQNGLINLKNKDSKWGDLFITSMFLGMIAAFLGMVFADIRSGLPGFIPIFVLLFSALLMAVCGLLIKKFHINWLENTNIYNLEEKKEYKQAVVDFISGMTDLYATANYKNILDGKIEN